MVETYLRQSPLAQQGLEGRAEAVRGSAGVAMVERRFPGIVDLRGQHKALSAAFELAHGFALPAEPNTTASKRDLTAFWLGPDEWWVLGPDGAQLARDLRETLAGECAAVTEVGESRTCIRVTGPNARDLIAKGCPLDLHPRVFGPGACAQGQLAKAGVLIHQIDEEPTYDIYVLRSFAEYLWLWLEDAAKEYGMVVVGG